MGTTNPEVDAYIEASPDFARSILTRVRKLVHRTCPKIRETIKWGAPTFELDGIVLGVASFKAHVNIGFWRGTELSDPEGLLDTVGKTNMCAFRVTSLSELPKNTVLASYIKEAAALDANRAASNQRSSGPSKARATKPSGGKRKAAKRLPVPADLKAALKQKQHAAARAAFEAFAPSHCNEYVQWITEAKRDATRAKRIATAMEWLAAGKSRNWKYE
jgi:hypothetical protein